jgi:cytoskeleton protein RodZ
MRGSRQVTGQEEERHVALPEDPGAVLKRARERIEVSTREVAGALNLPIGVVEAIEANDLARMPQRVFARGYIRGYARLLDLDAEAIVAGFHLDDPVVEPVRDHRGATRRRLQILLVVLVPVLLVAAVGTAVWYLVSAIAAPDTSEQDPVARSAPNRVTPRPTGTTSAQSSTTTAPEPAAEIATSAPEAVAGVPLPSGGQRITESGDDELEFTFTADCWVEVRDTSGVNLYSDLGRAGGELRLVGAPPFRIRLGYAPGAVVTYNGENIPLAPHTRNNVASLVLGQ